MTFLLRHYENTRNFLKETQIHNIGRGQHGCCPQTSPHKDVRGSRPDLIHTSLHAFHLENSRIFNLPQREGHAGSSPPQSKSFHFFLVENLRNR